MANGQKNCPVRSITNPVRAGATIPERLPMQFCMPVQRPAARGPATVWVMAQRLAAQAAQQVVTPINMAMERPGGESTHAMRKTAAPTSPAAVNVLRTRVGVAPLMIQRSASRPHTVADRAAARYE